MSYWTHVNSSIRIDNIYGNEKKMIRKIKKILGPIDSSWLPRKNKPKNLALPNGSEGSLNYTITPLYSKTTIYNNKQFRGVIINIFGDLRDFGSKKEYWSESNDTTYLVNWFRGITDALNQKFIILQGILEYEAEDEDHGWILQIVDGTSWRLSEAIRYKTPKSRASKGD